MPQKSPNLLFGPGGNSGFTPAGISGFAKLSPAVVVRELVQNSLDAARAADRTTAKVHFRISKILTEKIPGIEEYRSAFEQAEKTQREFSKGRLAQNAKTTVSKINDALTNPESVMLTVFDNGIGLDEGRMHALLSDGVSVKDESETGTYGNGHSTAIPASDLRYLLYAGITEDRQRIVSGHAVIASHQVGEELHLRSGDGYFIADFSQGGHFEYCHDPSQFELFSDSLEYIESNFKHGSAVLIPAFNYFREEEKSFCDLVKHAAAANFFVAIDEGQLELSIQDGLNCDANETSILNKDSLYEALDTLKENTIIKRSSTFLNPQRAFDAYETYRLGERHQISTREGKIDIFLKDSSSGIVRCDLFRNGMWITDKIPRLNRRNFTSREPFQAILSLTASIGGSLHNYIRAAESPLHDEIVLKSLSSKDSRACGKALTEIREWILSNTDELKTESFQPPDFLNIDVADASEYPGVKSPSIFWGEPTLVGAGSTSQNQRDPKSDDHVTEIGPSGQSNGSVTKGGNRRDRARPTLSQDFLAASRPLGDNRLCISIKCSKDSSSAELRLLVHEAFDGTCRRQGLDPYSPAILSNIKIGGNDVSKAAFRYIDGNIVGVSLGNLKSGDERDIEVSYHLTRDFGDIPNPSLRVEIFRGSDAVDDKT